mgnify:FL=1|tara:strand:- start:179 stop:328 length:150 start_codon:yes stop_codon:yes gene_type:complete
MNLDDIVKRFKEILQDKPQINYIVMLFAIKQIDKEFNHKIVKKRKIDDT